MASNVSEHATTDDRAALNPAQRARTVARMKAETFDVLVVGGGVVGTGSALDAAPRAAPPS
jgi:glycerol-3-phosphate dehydrogenase